METDSTYPESLTIDKNSRLVSRFLVGLKTRGILTLIINGKSPEFYDGLYKSFIKQYPDIDLTREEFQEKVIESFRRTMASVMAEGLAVVFSVVGNLFGAKMNAPKEIAGPITFALTMLANLIGYAVMHYYSHRHNEGQTVALLKEYFGHFFWIAAAYDLPEGLLVHMLVNAGMGPVLAALAITGGGSLAAIWTYIEEQKGRGKEPMYKKFINYCINGVKNAPELAKQGIEDLFTDIKSQLSRIVELSYRLGSMF